MKVTSDSDYRYQEYKVLEKGINNKYIQTETIVLKIILMKLENTLTK